MFSRISNDDNPNNKAVWLDGGMHGRELISTAAATYIIKELVFNWDNLPEELKNITWYIDPVFNPDGYQEAMGNDRLWRKSHSMSEDSDDVGVDLNRNYSVSGKAWRSSEHSSSSSYGGPRPFSEFETRAHRDFLNTIKEPITGFISLHSDAQCILYPK